MQHYRTHLEWHNLWYITWTSRECRNKIYHMKTQHYLRVYIETLYLCKFIKMNIQIMFHMPKICSPMHKMLTCQVVHKYAHSQLYIIVYHKCITILWFTASCSHAQKCSQMQNIFTHQGGGHKYIIFQKLRWCSYAQKRCSRLQKYVHNCKICSHAKIFTATKYVHMPRCSQMQNMFTC